MVNRYWSDMHSWFHFNDMAKAFGIYSSIDEELFWADVDEDGTKKDVGWEFLNAEARVDSGDEPSEEESAFEIDSEDESEEDDDDDDFSLDEESSDNLDDEAYSDEDISEEEGDWEREARNADKKRRFDLEDDNRGSSRKRSDEIMSSLEAEGVGLDDARRTWRYLPLPPRESGAGSQLSSDDGWADGSDDGW